MSTFQPLNDLQKGIVWMMQLLAVACLSLAAKMEETEVPVSLDLQVSTSLLTKTICLIQTCP